MPIIDHKRMCGFALGSGSGTPADAETTFIGGQPGTPIATASGVHKFTMVENGRIKKAFVSWYASTDAGTNEAVTAYIRVNNTTDYAIATVATNVKLKEFTNVALDIPLVATDYFEVKILCPTWVTNPTAVRIGGMIFYEA